MPWYCTDGCGERRFGDQCKCGERTAERIPPLDGWAEMSRTHEEGKEILRVLCGSRAYGLEHGESDYDYHGIFVVDTERLLTPWVKTSDTSWIEGDEDNTAWEVGHFLKLALSSNPTVLETFKAPVDRSTAWGDSIRRLFPSVISAERAYNSFRGYGFKQRNKMLERKDSRQFKFAVALIRVLIHGIELQRTGDYHTKLLDCDVYVPCQSGGTSDMRIVVKFLHEVRKGEWSIGRVANWSIMLEDELDKAYENTVLPPKPDLERVEQTLMSIRRAHFNGLRAQSRLP